MKKLTNKQHRSKAPATCYKQSDEFYQQRCWLDLWLENFDFAALEFWGQLEEVEAASLLSCLEKAGFVTRIDAVDRSHLQVHPTYYSEPKIRRIQAKPPVPGTPKAAPVQHSLSFRNGVQRLWTSMRILQSFSVGQLQACSNVTNGVARTVVFQFYQLNYLHLLSYYPNPCFCGNENQYQLIQNTGARSPILCGDGLLYDTNTNCIHQLVSKAEW